MTAVVDLAGTGATWVLYFLIALSSVQLAIILERAVVYRRARAPRTLRRDLRIALERGGSKAAAQVAAGPSLEARVIASGAASAERGPEAAQEIMRSTLVEEKLRLERGLALLGTLGNNAPFLGLFGTVLGVIHATADLSTTAGHAGGQVMAGISEALVSTAVGLLVALPAVAAYNYFTRVVKTRALAAEALGGELIARLVAPVATRKAA
ncbi:MAG TPA: MotA/TolQ/ExbB proton channel family protein [Kofleriaceae bacterium]|nr:MotA/TolQ/ExbB proton channel family protein [Kofleriaceae bacterium]